MKTASLVSVALASLLAVACSAPPVENDLGDGNGTPSSSSKKNSGNSPEGLPNTTKSDPTPTPTPTPTPAPSATPAPKPPTPITPPVDPNANACADLGQCCAQLQDSYGQFACLAVQLVGKADTCAKSLIACKLSVSIGGGGNQGGNDQFCQDDFDCPGDLICDNNLCH